MTSERNKNLCPRIICCFEYTKINTLFHRLMRFAYRQMSFSHFCKGFFRYSIVIAFHYTTMGIITMEIRHREDNSGPQENKHYANFTPLTVISAPITD